MRTSIVTRANAVRGLGASAFPKSIPLDGVMKEATVGCHRILRQVIF